MCTPPPRVIASGSEAIHLAVPKVGLFRRYAPRNDGFSLVELSIVLVILGLLVGGILAGKSLIRASELRAVGTEFQRYQTATHAFRDKYFALPGDFRDATRFWGRLNSNADCVTYSSAAVGSPGVCDGSGDGLVGSPLAASTSGEMFQFWRQLANAGLIEGTYTGIADTGGVQHSTGESNVPASKFPRGIWTVAKWNNTAATGVSSNFYAYDYGNFFSIGASSTTGWGWNSLFTPGEAWNIDNKLDDGMPGRGKVLSRWNTCTTGVDVNAFDATYQVSRSTPYCVLIFARQF